MKRKILHLIKRRIADLEFYINNAHNDATGVLLLNPWIYAKERYEQIHEDLSNKPDAYWESDNCKEDVIGVLKEVYISESQEHLEEQYALKHFYMFNDCELLMGEIEKL